MNSFLLLVASIWAAIIATTVFVPVVDAGASPEVNGDRKYNNPVDCNCQPSFFCPAGGCRCIEDRDYDNRGCASVCTPVGGGTSTTCQDGVCCRSRRRKLQGADLAFDHNDPQHQAMYAHYLERCGSLEYDVLLFVTSHFYAVASPKKAAVDLRCPFVVTHVYFNDEDSSAQKQLLYWESKERGEARFADGSLYEKSYHIEGTFRLDDLARAYEQADPATKGPYDIVRNSCATYVVDLAQAMNISIDHHITTFVGRRLVEESSSNMMEKIRAQMLSVVSSSSGGSSESVWYRFWEWLMGFFSTGTKTSSDGSDEELVHKFVTDRVSEILQD